MHIAKNPHRCFPSILHWFAELAKLHGFLLLSLKVTVLDTSTHRVSFRAVLLLPKLETRRHRGRLIVSWRKTRKGQLYNTFMTL